MLEGRARKGPAASSLERQPSDRGSTGAIGLAFLLAGLFLLAAPGLNYLGVGRLSVSASGPRAEHHPPWSLPNDPSPRLPRVILMWVGAALATGNWVCVAVASIAMLSAYTYRIRSEEEMLLGTSGYDESQGSHLEVDSVRLLRSRALGPTDKAE